MRIKDDTQLLLQIIRNGLIRCFLMSYPVFVILFATNTKRLCFIKKYYLLINFTAQNEGGEEMRVSFCIEPSRDMGGVNGLFSVWQDVLGSSSRDQAPYFRVQSTFLYIFTFFFFLASDSALLWWSLRVQIVSLLRLNWK